MDRLNRCRDDPQKIREVCNELIRTGEVNIRDSFGYTPLHFACAHEPEMVPLLLKHGADVNAVTTEYKMTPLHYACAYQPSIIDTLIEHGANIYAKSKYDYSPLHFVEPVPALESLLKHGVDINTQTVYGEPIVYTFALAERYPLVEELLKRGANTNIWYRAGSLLSMLCMRSAPTHLIRLAYDVNTLKMNFVSKTLHEIIAVYAGMCWKRSDVGGLPSHVMVKYLVQISGHT
jgi:ankyrin repeat protein